MRFTDNLSAVLASYEHLFPATGHVLTVANVMEYARYLNDRQGYFVFNNAKLLEIARENIRELMESDAELSDQNIVNALDKAGFEYVNWLLNLSGGVQPPYRAGEGPRQATRGGWATITGNLRASFRHRVDEGKIRKPKTAKPNPKQTQLTFPE